MRAILPMMLLVALAFPADAGHCLTYSTENALATVPDPVGAVGGDVYLVLPVVCMIGYDLLECGGMYVYQESNGIAGLQRGDDGVDSTCHGSIRPDTILL